MGTGGRGEGEGGGWGRGKGVVIESPESKSAVPERNLISGS